MDRCADRYAIYSIMCSVLINIASSFAVTLLFATLLCSPLGVRFERRLACWRWTTSLTLVPASPWPHMVSVIPHDMDYISVISRHNNICYVVCRYSVSIYTTMQYTSCHVMSCHVMMWYVMYENLP